MHYAQAYVQSDDDTELDVDGAFADQKNGLCGAAVAGSVVLTTGLQTGDVGLRVLIHDSEPPAPDPTWEDVVEFPFTATGATVELVDFEGDVVCVIPLDTGDFRARCSATGMDEGHALDTTEEDEISPDHYLLEFWPHPTEPDRVLRTASALARRWNSTRGTAE